MNGWLGSMAFLLYFLVNAVNNENGILLLYFWLTKDMTCSDIDFYLLLDLFVLAILDTEFLILI